MNYSLIVLLLSGIQYYQEKENAPSKNPPQCALQGFKGSAESMVNTKQDRREK
jgi:hypothetical protein